MSGLLSEVQVKVICVPKAFRHSTLQVLPPSDGVSFTDSSSVDVQAYVSCASAGVGVTVTVYAVSASGDTSFAA